MDSFNFSEQLKTELSQNGKAWGTLLYKACLEGKEAQCKASVFAETLRKSGFRCGTGPARAAYKVVRDGGDQKVMIAAVTAVKAKRKAKGTATGTATGTDTGTATGTDTGTATGTADTGTADTGTADTLVGALKNALDAAKSGHLEVCETWLAKASAILDAAKQSTAQAIERLGGVA